MKTFFGLLLIVIGIVAGLYIGVYLMFIGGIFDLINFVKSDLHLYGLLVWGILKIIFASFLGWLSAIVLIIPGLALLES